MSPHARIRRAPRIHAEPVALQEQDVVGIDGADGIVPALIERPDRRAADVTRLVDRVVAGHPRMAAIAQSQRLPQVDDAVLEVPVRPEECPVRRVVAVPSLVLTAGQRVQVDDRVEPVPGGEEHVEEPVEEPAGALLPEGPAQGGALERFGPGEAGDEVLHVHPAAQAHPAQHDRPPAAGGEVASADL
jgi:hypothetical protein